MATRTSPITKTMLTALALGLAAPAAMAQSVSASNPASVVAALQDAGYKAELGTDSAGDPKVASAMGGVNFHVFFYGCEANTACQDLQFSAGFDLTDGIDMAVVNDWNSSKFIGKA